jgi:hypothetical protein
MRFFNQTLTIFWLLILSAPNAFPTSCRSYSDRSSFRKARVVFLGQPVEYVNNPNLEQDPYLIVRFKVQQAWKGVDSPEIIIRSDLGIENWEHFEIGKTYIVYADGKNLYAPMTCGRSEQLIDAKFANFHQQQERIRKLNNWWYRSAARIFPF